MNRVAWISLVCLALGCTERRAEPEARPVTLPMRGCVHVSRLCEVGEVPLVFFAENATAARAELDGEALVVRTVEDEGGLRIEVDVPARRGTLTVFATEADASRFMRVSVGPVPTEEAPMLAAARSSTTKPVMGDGASTDAPSDRSAVRRGTSGGEAQEADSADARSPRRPPTDREVALGRFADARRLYREGDAEAALAALDESAKAADRDALRSQASRSRLLTVWIAAKSLRDFEVARAALEKVPERSPYDGEADVLRAYHAAVLASEVGDRREALAQIAVAKRLARQLGDGAMATKAEIAELNTLDELGRFEESAKGWRALVEAGTGDGCLDAFAMSNLGWSLMRAKGAAIDEPGRWFEQAIDTHTKRCTSGDPTLPANVLVSAAHFHQQRGELDRAAAALERAAELPMLPEYAQWHQIVAGGVALARGDVKLALDCYADLARLADATRMTEAAWHAWVGTGKSLEAKGDLDGAARAYAEAETRTAREAVLVPIDGGRLHLFGDRDESARRWASIELARGRPAAALAVVRRARRRALASIEVARRLPALDGESRARWELEVERYRKTRDALERKSAGLWLRPKSERAKLARELDRTIRDASLALDGAIGALERRSMGESNAVRFRDPEPGELVVAWYPVVEGWAIFGMTSEADVRAVVVDAAPSADTVVARLHDAIVAARRITVLPPGGSRGFGLHRADLDGAPLGQRKLVAYALDLPPRAEPAEHARIALVVSDPRGDLNAARTEGDDVARILEQAGWSTERARADAATRARFLTAMTRVRLLHYAGHGSFGGYEGWDSSLLLADGRLTVGDILTATTAPEAVVLLGCRTAQNDDVAASAGLGIAQAFVLAGAHGVVAATREIDDGAAAALSERIFSELRDGSDLLATYQRSVHGTDEPIPEWDAFVLLTP